MGILIICCLLFIYIYTESVWVDDIQRFTHSAFGKENEHVSHLQDFDGDAEL